MGPDACLYKQSQSHRLGDGPEGPDTPPCHYSIIPPFCAKQTQFLREWNDMQMLLRKEVMKDPASQRRRKNKANFGVTGETPVVLMGQTPMLRNPWRRLPACAGMTLLRTRLLRQTNPIFGRAERRISSVWIRSCDEWDTGEAVKKQSQFDQGSRLRGQASATWHATPARGPLRQTNPICARAISRTSAAPTRTCNASDAGRTRAKQSQFPEAGHRSGVSIADFGLRIADWGPTWGTPNPRRAQGQLRETNPKGGSR